MMQQTDIASETAFITSQMHQRTPRRPSMNVQVDAHGAPKSFQLTTQLEAGDASPRRIKRI